MPGTTVKVRSSQGGEFDCYLALPPARRQGAGRRAGLRHPRRRQGPARHRRRIRGARASSPPRPTCSGARSPARWGSTTSAPPSAPSRGRKRSRPARPTWPTRSRICARCRSSTAAPRRWDSATAAPTRSSGRSGSATPPACPATARGCRTTSASSTASRQPVCIMWGDQDHVAPNEVLDAYRAVPPRQSERRGAHLPRHSARLHDAGPRQGVTTRKARAFSMARALAILEGCAAKDCGRRRSGRG